MWLQPTSYRVHQLGAGCTALTVQCFTRPVYRLYSLVFTKTGYRVITSTTGYRADQVPAIQPCVYPSRPFNPVLILVQVDVEASTKKLLQPTGYEVYRPGAGLHSLYFDSSLPVFAGYRDLLVTEQTTSFIN